MHNRRLPGHILKVDFSKVFDSVDWDFLFDLLEARGFGRRWVGWMQSLLFSSKANILVNGSLSGYVRYRRGLRQGDPLSPLLLVLVTDVLGTMFSHALCSRVLIGVPLGNQGPMCNLHYVDDLLVLTTGVWRNYALLIWYCISLKECQAWKPTSLKLAFFLLGYTNFQIFLRPRPCVARLIASRSPIWVSPFLRSRDGCPPGNLVNCPLGVDLPSWTRFYLLALRIGCLFFDSRAGLKRSIGFGGIFCGWGRTLKNLNAAWWVGRLFVGHRNYIMKNNKGTRIKKKGIKL